MRVHLLKVFSAKEGMGWNHVLIGCNSSDLSFSYFHTIMDMFSIPIYESVILKPINETQSFIGIEKIFYTCGWLTNIIYFS